MNNDRRTFIRNAGVAVTATVASGGVAATGSDAASLQHQLGLLEDSNAIRALQQRYFALVQQRNAAEVATLFAGSATPVHTAIVLDTRFDEAQIDVAQDRRSATAQLRSRVRLATPMSGDGTLQQMARLQGQVEQQWNEAGVYTAHYVKVGTEWKISALQFHKT